MTRLLLIIIVVTQYFDALSTVYYSRNPSGGNWNNVNSWTASSTGSGVSAGSIPGRADSVVILNGHTISISSTSDNGSAGVSPDGLSRTNVGSFNGSGTNAFYQTGSITVMTGGTLTGSVRLMFEGKVVVQAGGTLNTTSNDDLVLLGNTQFKDGSSISIDDDIICTGNSTTFIGNGISFTTDDLYLDHTNALLCGDTLNITDAIQEFNSADANTQLCQNFVVNCSDGDCCNTNPPSPCSTPFVGSGMFVLPVELISFSNEIVNGTVVLYWVTASEVNNDFFEIQRNFSGNWESIGRVEGHGTTAEAQSYFFNDLYWNSASLTYYRLKQVDVNGRESYSRAVVVKNEKSQKEEISILSEGKTLKVTFDQSFGEGSYICVINGMGERVMTMPIKSEGAQDEITMSTEGLSAGCYTIGIIGQKNTYFKKIIQAK
jgi:hypothetical protein